MSDNTSHGIFGNLFAFAAERKDAELMKTLVKMSRNYDFSLDGQDFEFISCAAPELICAVYIERWGGWSPMLVKDADKWHSENKKLSWAEYKKLEDS